MNLSDFSVVRFAVDDWRPHHLGVYLEGESSPTLVGAMLICIGVFSTGQGGPPPGFEAALSWWRDMMLQIGNGAIQVTELA